MQKKPPWPFDSIIKLIDHFMPLARYILLTFLGFFFISCQKQPVQQPVPVPGTTVDRPALMLKDMIEQGLPSPYYHFEYNDSGFISKVDFSSGLSLYDLTYVNGKIDKMVMNKDVPFDTKKDKLFYIYENTTPSGVMVFDKNGVLYRRCLLTFSLSHQLQQLEWDIKADNGSFIKEINLEFSYYSNSNLEKIRYQNFPAGSQTASTYQDKFEDYDDKSNVDGFALLHINPFFLDLLLLPSVRLQQNNPGKVIHTGDGENYQINYSYVYDEQKRPLKKSGDFFYTAGADAGTHVQILTTFSYY